MTSVWVVTKECEESTMVLGVFSSLALAEAYANSLRAVMSMNLAFEEFDIDEPTVEAPRAPAPKQEGEPPFKIGDRVRCRSSVVGDVGTGTIEEIYFSHGEWMIGMRRDGEVAPTWAYHGGPASDCTRLDERRR